MINQEELTCILQLPVNIYPGGASYESIQYSSELKWEKNDQEKIQTIIDNILNSTEPKGEKTIVTSNGEILIKYQMHPGQNRMKLIQGFIKQTASSVTLSIQHYRISDLLKAFLLEGLINDKETSLYLEAIDTLCNLQQKNSETLHSHLFMSILDFLVKEKDDYLKYKDADCRFQNIINNLREIVNLEVKKTEISK